MSGMRTVVIGASSGLGRCIGVGLAERGADVVLMARRKDRLDDAVQDAAGGEGTAVAIECDVTDPESVEAAIAEAAETLGGIDALVYTPGIGVLSRIEDTDAATWARVFATNVTGASLATAAALAHLRESEGRVMYLSSVSASATPPWPGLGSYGVSKAALDKLVESWRNEHPEIAFCRIIVGECAGGEGDAMTGFAAEWDASDLGDLVGSWVARNYMTGNLMDVRNLVDAVEMIVRSDTSVCHRTVTVAPRLVTPT